MIRQSGRQWPRLFYALDVGDLASFWRELPVFLECNVGIKVGYEAFFSFGRPLVDQLIKAGAVVFLDLKLHDIPKTVESGIRKTGEMGVQFTTVHLMNSAEALSLARSAATDNLKILGVTVLTSHSQGDLDELHGCYVEPEVSSRHACGSVQLVVNNLAQRARRFGIDGIICSGADLPALELGDDLGAVCPGIRMAGDPVDDQQRVVTPAQAYQAGARSLVMGRSIRARGNLKSTLEGIIECKR